MNATACHQEWFHPNRRNSLLLIVALATLAGCRDTNDTPLAPDDPGLSPVFAVADGANSGNPHFFFLPPNVPAPSFSGTFDPNRSPEARICLLVAGVCSGADVATFTLSSPPNNITVDLPAEQYRFRWKTKDANVAAGQVYRTRVFLGPVLLGFLDIQIVATNADLASVPAGFAGVVVDKNLQIHFRIEVGAVPPILFESDRTGDFEIYVLDADGIPHNVSNSPGTPDRNGVWSPDGTQLLFGREVVPSTNFEIYKVNADGTGLINLTNNPARDLFPDWSPNGTQIVFHTDRDGFFEIYKMNTSGSALVRLTNNTIPDLLAHWSPDGTKIAFERVFPVMPQGNNREIMVMNADGTGEVRLTNNAAPNDGFGTWSPNGTQIAFFTDRDGNLEVYVMNADGIGTPTNLSNNPGIDGGVVDWSPDGTTITWTGTHPPGNPEIFGVLAAGGTPFSLTNSAGVDNASRWSPDGSRIIFVSARDGNFEVYVMNANGSGQTRITNHSGEDVRPVWRQ